MLQRQRHKAETQEIKDGRVAAVCGDRDTDGQAEPWSTRWRYRRSRGPSRSGFSKSGIFDSKSPAMAATLSGILYFLQFGGYCSGVRAKFMRLLFRLAVCSCLLMLMVVDAHADRRVALVIGNGAYRNVPALPNPPNDAADVAASLKRSGFDIIFETNLDQGGMQDAAIRFAREARTADVALFYYSGHALQFGGVNYLIPVDAILRDEVDLRRMARADEILADLQQAKNLRILVLDACRDNPFADSLKRSLGLSRSVSVGRGLAKMESPDGTIISYATQAGKLGRASDDN